MSDSLPAVRVIKLGGSLLELGDLEQRFEDWNSRQTQAVSILIVGGGQPVDAIRHKVQHNSMDAAEIHWNCIEAMDQNSRTIASKFRNWKLVTDVNKIQPDACPSNLVLAPLRWCQEYAIHLPTSWDVTSDSISAEFAGWIKARELVLLKSADPPTGNNIPAAIEKGYVDPYFLAAIEQGNQRFATHAKFLVRAVNIRDAAFRETNLL